MTGPEERPPAETRSPYGWPKRFRLRTSAEFRRVQRTGHRRRMPWFSVVVLPNDLGHPRFGFAVSRKVGNAVVRNRVKRRLREVFRHLRPTLGPVDVVVVAHPEAAEASLTELWTALERALKNERRPEASPG